MFIEFCRVREIITFHWLVASKQIQFYTCPISFLFLSLFFFFLFPYEGSQKLYETKRTPWERKYLHSRLQVLSSEDFKELSP